MEEGREEWDEVEVAPKCMLMFQHKDWTAEELLFFFPLDISQEVVKS